LKTAQLIEFCHLITDGTHYTPPNIGVGVPFLTVADMLPTGLNFRSCSRIDPAEFERAKAQNSAPIVGDVLFSKDGTVGKVHVVREQADFAVLSSIAIIRPDPAKLDAGFLAHFLRTRRAVAAAARSKTGSALRRIILKDIKRLRLTAPTLAEQKRLAAILDRAEAIRCKHIEAAEKAGELLKVLRQQAMQEQL
jgi:type I restriction enzyme, S subunit